MQPEPDQRITGLVTSREAGLAVPAHITLPLDIKAEVGGMTMHLLTSDRLDAIESGGGSSESNAFSAAFAVFLTIAGLMLGAKTTGTELGKLSAPLWGLLFATLGLSLYFWWQWRAKERKAKERFRDIREKSATVVGLKAN